VAILVVVKEEEEEEEEVETGYTHMCLVSLI
jgi:hypothetical protein